MACASEKTVILTLGNELRGDDAAGIVFGRLVEKTVPCTVVEGGEVPENVTGLVLREHPGRILVVDAMDFGGKPGESRLFPGNDIAAGGVSTHGTLKLCIEYLAASSGAEVSILGFQPKSLDTGEKLSPEVESGVREQARRFHLAGGIPEPLPSE